MDVRSCRLFALTQREQPLPALRFQDTFEPCLDDSGVLDPTFDFYYVDAEISWDRELCGCTNRKECPFCHGSEIPACRRRAAPYDGAHIYPVDVVLYLLDQQVIQHRHVQWGVRASGHFNPKILQEASDTIAMAYSRCEADNFEIGQRPEKLMMLSCLGIWAINAPAKWVVKPVTADGLIGRFDHKTHLPDGTTLCKTRVAMLTTRSYYPLALIFLWREQIFMQRARQVMARIERVQWRAEIVDGIYVTCSQATGQHIEEEIAQDPPRPRRPSAAWASCPCTRASRCCS